MKAGVPQNSILGSLSINLLLNPNLLADDTLIIKNHTQYCIDSNTDLRFQWKMNFSPDTTKQALGLIFLLSFEKKFTFVNFQPKPCIPGSPSGTSEMFLDIRLNLSEHIKTFI